MVLACDWHSSTHDTVLGCGEVLSPNECLNLDLIMALGITHVSNIEPSVAINSTLALACSISQAPPLGLQHCLHLMRIHTCDDNSGARHNYLPDLRGRHHYAHTEPLNVQAWSLDVGDQHNSHFQSNVRLLLSRYGNDRSSIRNAAQSIVCSEIGLAQRKLAIEMIPSRHDLMSRSVADLSLQSQPEQWSGASFESPNNNRKNRILHVAVLTPSACRMHNWLLPSLCQQLGAITNSLVNLSSTAGRCTVLELNDVKHYNAVYISI